MSKGKTASITGAFSDIGKAFANIHAERGGDLMIVARSEDKLNALKTELEGKHGDQAHVIVKDLSEKGADSEVYDEAKVEGLTVNYLINNPGFRGRGKFHEREWLQDLDMIYLDVVALTKLTRKFLPDFGTQNVRRILNG